MVLRPRIINFEPIDQGVRVNVFVDGIAAAMARYTHIQVWRSDTVDGTYAEVSGVGTRPVLVAGLDVYSFDDSTGTGAKFYKVRLYNPTGPVASDYSDILAGSTSGYVSLAEMRAVGVSSTIASDTTVLTLIAAYQGFIEDRCRQWFQPRRAEMLLDGNDTAIMPLGVPIISVSALYANDDFVNELPADSYVVYSGRGNSPDDRRNPRVKLVSGEWLFDPYRAPSVRSSGLKFGLGKQNQKLVGTFGFVERDGSTPALIKRAIMKLVKQACVPGQGIAGSTSVGVGAGALKREVVDKNEREYFAAATPMAITPNLAVVKDPEIDGIIAQYKGPSIVKFTGTGSVGWR